MYDYYDEVKNVLDSIHKLVERVNNGSIKVPEEELSEGETPAEHVYKAIERAIIRK